MILEDYCSYELSKLLKEKGFDGECIGCYWDSKKIFDINYEPLSYSDGDLRDEVIIAPTHQMAMKWLREVHRKYIDIRYNNKNEEYRFIVFTMVKDKPIDFIHSEYHSTYEEAVEAAIKYSLEKLI